MAFLDWIRVDIPEETREEGRRSGNSPLLEFPFTVPAIRALAERERLEFHPQVTFLTGENGSGKSTLLEGIADLRRLDKEGITKNFRQTKEYFSELRPYLKQSRTAYPADEYFLRAESFFKVSEIIDRHRRAEPYRVALSYGPRAFEELSHGQGFLALMNFKFQGRGFFMMDEPESALSVQGQYTALAFMKRMVDRGSQFIVATHSPLLLAFPDAWIYRLSEDGIERVEYESCDPYVMTRRFLEDPGTVLGRILGDGPDSH